MAFIVMLIHWHWGINSDIGDRLLKCYYDSCKSIHGSAQQRTCCTVDMSRAGAYYQILCDTNTNTSRGEVPSDASGAKHRCICGD